MRVQQRHGRRGAVFSLRLTERERSELDRLRHAHRGPPALGRWLVWAASLMDDRDAARTVLPNQAAAQPVIPELAAAQPVCNRVILDLCAGSGAWSEPYFAAGYQVVCVTWPEHDVRTYIPPSWPVWGVLAAPPCTEFSLAKNGQSRDFRRALEVVAACMRIVLSVRPRWWALENPVGKLSTWLGTPVDVFEPSDFGDPWTKRTALWGDFALPKRGPFVETLGPGPFCKLCDPEAKRREWCRDHEHRAVTPPGFARAFYEANP